MADELTQPGTGTGDAGGTVDPAPSTTGQTGGWAMPQKWQGKPPEEIARAYDELERKLGTQGQELGSFRKYAEQANQFIEAFRPVLSKYEYNPQRLAQALEAQAQQAAASGQPGQAQQLHAAAQRSWADLMSPHEQQQWIDSFVTDRVSRAQEAQAQQFQQGLAQMAQYVNTFGDLAIRAIEAKLANPALSLNTLLQEAVNEASGRYDPLTRAAQRLSAPTNEAMREQIRKEERAKLAAERKNQDLTTFVGANPTGKRPLMPPPEGATPTNPAAPPSMAHAIASAKEKFVRNWDKIASAT